MRYSLNIQSAVNQSKASWQTHKKTCTVVKVHLKELNLSLIRLIQLLPERLFIFTFPCCHKAVAQYWAKDVLTVVTKNLVGYFPPATKKSNSSCLIPALLMLVLCVFTSCRAPTQEKLPWIAIWKGNSITICYLGTFQEHIRPDPRNVDLHDPGIQICIGTCSCLSCWCNAGLWRKGGECIRLCLGKNVQSAKGDYRR